MTRTVTARDHRLPVMATFDERRRRHTWRDLDFIVRFAADTRPRQFQRLRVGSPPFAPE